MNIDIQKATPLVLAAILLAQGLQIVLSLGVLWTAKQESDRAAAIALYVAQQQKQHAEHMDKAREQHLEFLKDISGIMTERAKASR